MVEYSGQEIVEHFIWLAFVSPAADSVPGRQKGVRQERAMAVCLLYAALHLGNHITARNSSSQAPQILRPFPLFLLRDSLSVVSYVRFLLQSRITVIFSVFVIHLQVSFCSCKCLRHLQQTHKCILDSTFWLLPIQEMQDILTCLSTFLPLHSQSTPHIPLKARKMEVPVAQIHWLAQ